MQVTIAIKTVEQKFAGGTVGGNWIIDVAQASDPATVIQHYEGAAPSTTVELTEGDTVVIRGHREDAGGMILGPVATTQYQVGEDLAPIDVANTISAVATPGTRGGGARR